MLALSPKEDPKSLIVHFSSRGVIAALINIPWDEECDPVLTQVRVLVEPRGIRVKEHG